MHQPTNSEFNLGGVNHVALVCRDMARTVDFYSNVLGMPLIKTLEIPGGGQHFFFDCGNGDCVAFFWFPNAPKASPGIAGAAAMPGVGDITSAHGSMNHLAFDVPADTFDAYVEKLKAKGVEVSPVLNHDDSERTVAEELHDGVFVRSVYFRDPDGILLEFACWTRVFGPEDALHAPADAEGRRVERAATG
ncbi:MAG: VOC family protein [Acidimicrobiia bacterium]|nr:VOC family protein [Acidimicrobiia bacterium]